MKHAKKRIRLPQNTKTAQVVRLTPTAEPRDITWKTGRKLRN